MKEAARRGRIPKHCLHKPSGRGYVRLGGITRYTGAWGSRDSEARYEEFLAQWLAGGRQALPVARPVAESYTLECLMADYWQHALEYYRDAEGRPTGEHRNIKTALGPLRDLFGNSLAADFGPLRLEEYRKLLIGQGLARSTINQRTRVICRMFRWAASQERVPHGVSAALGSLPGLRRGRSKARETEPVHPVADSAIEAVLPHLSPTVAAMVQVQVLTGMRPGELVQLCGAMLDRSGPIWQYRPAKHKTSYLGRARVVYFGSKAQDILRPLLTLDPNAPLFRPSQADLEFRQRKRDQRKSKEPPSQQRRRMAAAKRPKRAFGEVFSAHSYRRAIHRACMRAGIAPWNPHRLRHTAATRIRREFGIEVARAVLGHSSPTVTERYAERDQGLAEAAMQKLG